jgi:hypothetical protein
VDAAGDLTRSDFEEPRVVQRGRHLVDVQRARHHRVDVETRRLGPCRDLGMLGRQVGIEADRRPHRRQFRRIQADQAPFDRRVLCHHLDDSMRVRVEVEVGGDQVRELEHDRRREETDQELVVVTGAQLLDGITLHLVQGVDDGHGDVVSSLVRLESSLSIWSRITD